MKTQNPASLTALQNLTANALEQVNQLIYQQLAAETQLIPTVSAYLINSGGKRLRPMLTLACAQLCDYAGGQHIPLAACVELLHTATLFHDDVIDDSHHRRGNHTANYLWGNPTSVLVGDTLFARSFQLMVSVGSLVVLKILSDAAATVTEGEVAQLAACRDPSLGFDAYLAIIRAKTAALFAAACEISAVIAQRPQAQAQALANFGYHLGLVFQLTDDLLDYAEEEKLGKQPGDDFRQAKISLPIVLAWQKASDAERPFWQRTIIERQQKDGDFAQAQELIRAHHCAQQGLAIAQTYAEIANDNLQIFPPSPIRCALKAALDSCLERGRDCI